MPRKLPSHLETRIQETLRMCIHKQYMCFGGKLLYINKTTTLVTAWAWKVLGTYAMEVAG